MGLGVALVLAGLGIAIGLHRGEPSAIALPAAEPADSELAPLAPKLAAKSPKHRAKVVRTGLRAGRATPAAPVAAASEPETWAEPSLSAPPLIAGELEAVAAAAPPPPPPAPVVVEAAKPQAEAPPPPVAVEPQAAAQVEEQISSDGNGLAIARAIAAQKRGAVQECFERELKANPKLNGTVLVELDLGPAQRVDQVRVSDDLERPAFTQCVNATMQHLSFMELNEEVSIQVPYVLSARAK